MKKQLTQFEFERKILEAKLADKKRTIINLGNNLFITVRPNSEKLAFSVRIKTSNKDTSSVIGYYPHLSLSQARAKAKSIIKELKDKQEAIEEQFILPTLGEALEEWFAYKSNQYKKGSTRPQNIKSIIKRTIMPSGIADKRISEITPKTISEKFCYLNQTQGNKHNAISIMNSCLQYFYLKGMLPFNPISDLLKGRESPFKKPKTVGFKFIAPEELSDKFLKPLSVTSHVNRVFYLYLLLTGFRFGEARLAHWSWFDFKKELIVIPADAIGANKTQTEYVKPMTKQIKQLILNWKDFSYSADSDYVFKSDYTKKALCEGTFREPVKALTSRELDLHGIRKVMRSWMSSQDIPVKIAELALQHDVRSSIEKVYDKYSYVEEIRQALQRWNDYVETQLPPEFGSLLTISGKE
ncbi:MAG: tyrosine-type recombinase/integrase [Succinivibrio sp.]